MAYQVVVPIEPVPITGGGLQFLKEIILKAKDPPLIKSFKHTITNSVNGTTVTESAHYTTDLAGPNTDNIKASADNPLLCVYELNHVAISAGLTIRSSDGLDTADGNVIYPERFPAGANEKHFPPVPHILKVNQYLTLSLRNVAAGTKTAIVEGFTVELPDDFVVA